MWENGSVGDDRRSLQPGQNLSEQAYELIGDMIVTLQVPPGSAISEIALGRQLGMSRTPVGEALQRLAREGLVVVLPRRGIIVSDLNAKQQLHLLEMRREIDRFIARIAARRADEQDRAQFGEIAARFALAAERNDPDLMLRTDKELHTQLATATRNEFAVNVADLTDGLSRRFWFAHHRKVGDLERSAGLRSALAAAVASGDEEAAAKASDALVDYLEDFTRATLSLDV